MADARWIVVRNWERFQHYKHRNPPWIKLYTSLSSDPDWYSLTAHQRGVLVTIWIEYARSKGRVRYEQAQSWVGAGFKHATLEALEQAGFIEFALAPRKQSATPELEIEKETPLPPYQGKPNGTVAAGATATRATTPTGVPCPHCGLIKQGPASLAEHIANVHYDTPVA